MNKMKYLKYTTYVYLIFGLFFVYDGISKLNSNETYWMSFAIAAVSVGMFFFRRSFAKKMEERNRKP